MSYNKTTWNTGDTITAAKMNNIENGIADGGVLIVNGTTDESSMTLDKTWNEISNATFAIVKYEGGTGQTVYSVLTQVVSVGNIVYTVKFFDAETSTEMAFVTNSADGYPTMSLGS